MKDGKFEVGDYITPRFLCEEPRPVAVVTNSHLDTGEYDDNAMEIKILEDPNYPRVVGTHMSCPNTSEMYELVLDDFEPASEDELMNLLLEV